MLAVMLQIAHLIALADEYQRACPIEDKTLSFRIFGDSKKLTALRGTSDLLTGRYNAAIAWFSANWPEKAKWPAEVARPYVPAPSPERAA